MFGRRSKSAISPSKASVKAIGSMVGPVIATSLNPRNACAAQPTSGAGSAMAAGAAASVANFVMRGT